MGIELAIGALVAAEAGKAVMEAKSANADEEALNLQAKETQLNYQQKTLQNLDAVQKVLDTQEAQMSVRGVAFSSPSYNAIQRNTLNIGAKNQSNLDTEKDIADLNIDTEKANVKNKLFASLFGDAASVAMTSIGIANKMPTMGDE